MTAQAALLAFFGQFATTYADDNVPDDAAYPYITVETRFGAFDDGDVPLVVNVWHRTDSDKACNDLVRYISASIGYGGAAVTCSDGWLWVKRGTPFAVAFVDPDDDAIKRRRININVEFITY